jgi:hypothetical protein
MKTTLYFQHTRQRPDRAIILDVWIEQVIKHPVREEIQSDGRIVAGHKLQKWTTEF